MGLIFVQLSELIVEKGSAEQVVERFSRKAPFEEMPGFIDRMVLVRKRTPEHDEVVVVTRWASEEAWQAWIKSDVHIQGHRDRLGQPKPEYIISSSRGLYDVKVLRTAEASE